MSRKLTGVARSDVQHSMVKHDLIHLQSSNDKYTHRTGNVA
jgi:hypothetical protein